MCDVCDKAVKERLKAYENNSEAIKIVDNATENHIQALLNCEDKKEEVEYRWRAVGFVAKRRVTQNLIKTETPYRNLSDEENTIVNNVVEYLDESYFDDYDIIDLAGTYDTFSASAEIDSQIENYKDEGEEVPEHLSKAFDLFEKLSDYSRLERIKKEVEE